MKKLFIAFCFIALLIATGCSTEMDTLSCQNTTSSNGVTTDTTYDIDYQGDKVKKVKITYDYTQDAVNNGTNQEGTATQNNDTSETARSSERNDGVNSDSDGLTEEHDSDKNLKSDDVVDGVVGDAIDSTINGVTNTILDLAGIRSTYENQINSYGNIKGFSYRVDKNLDNEYKVIYEIDMDKISDSDLSKFSVSTRDFSDLKKSYQDLGYTCK